MDVAVSCGLSVAEQHECPRVGTSRDLVRKAPCSRKQTPLVRKGRSLAAKRTPPGLFLDADNAAGAETTVRHAQAATNTVVGWPRSQAAANEATETG